MAGEPKRLQLQTLLQTTTGLDEPHVHFQPPNNVQMNLLEYPCAVYEWDDTETEYADDLPYGHTKRYSVTIIDQNPDSVIPDKVAKLPTARFDRRFTADNLYHTVYVLFF